MRRRTRHGMVLGATLVWLVSGTAVVAQERPDTTMEALREKVRADKKLVVALALNLSETEAKAFWPVYGAYQSDMIVHYDRVAKLIADYAAAHEKMNDETANQLLGEFLALQTDHAALLNRYVPRFQRVLPPQKVARFYQIENKVRAILDYQLARDIPLVK
jgi:hypothetical protein